MAPPLKGKVDEGRRLVIGAVHAEDQHGEDQQQVDRPAQDEGFALQRRPHIAPLGGKVTQKTGNSLETALQQGIDPTYVLVNGVFYVNDPAGVTVLEPGADLRTIFLNAQDGETYYLNAGTYTLNNLIEIKAKSLNIIGLGDVTIKATTAHHMFVIHDHADPDSEMVVNITNIDLDGGDICKQGLNIKYNVTVNLQDMTVENTGWAPIILDNGNLFVDGKAYDGVTTTVNAYNVTTDSTVALNALPRGVNDQSNTEYYTHDTYAVFNYDSACNIPGFELQSVCGNTDNLIINEI